MKPTFNHRQSSVILFFLFSLFTARAQTADSLICQQLRDYGIQFTTGNSVTLLMSGQQKFDDMFAAIRQARHSVHLEYFNFRNDSTVTPRAAKSSLSGPRS